MTEFSTARRFLITVVVVTMVALVVPALCVIMVDPFQIYHRPLFSKMGLSSNQRYQNAGLINTYLSDPDEGYDSIVVGTSMSANITSAQIRSSFGWDKTLRLMLKGGDPAEIRQTVFHALDTGNVQHLLLEFNPWHYLDDYEVSRLDPVFPGYLYNDSWLDDYPYLFSLDSLQLSIQLLRGDFSSYDLTFETIGQSYYQEFKHDTFNENIKEELKTGKTWNETLVKWPMQKRLGWMAFRIEKDFMPVIDRLCHSGINVVVYVPPLSRLYYLDQGMMAQEVVYMPRQVLRHIQPCQNIRLHAFDTMSFVDDLNYYRDTMHYTDETSIWLLGRMAGSKNLLIKETITEYEDEWVDRINARQAHSSYPAKLSWVNHD